MDRGVLVFQVDESVFIGDDGLRFAWSRPGDNITYNVTPKQRCQRAVAIAAISTEGYLIYHVQKGYMDSKDIIKFLKQIKSECSRIGR